MTVGKSGLNRIAISRDKSAVGRGGVYCTRRSRLRAGPLASGSLLITRKLRLKSFAAARSSACPPKHGFGRRGASAWRSRAEPSERASVSLVARNAHCCFIGCGCAVGVFGVHKGTRARSCRARSPPPPTPLPYPSRPHRQRTSLHIRTHLLRPPAATMTDPPPRRIRENNYTDIGVAGRYSSPTVASRPAVYPTTAC